MLCSSPHYQEGPRATRQTTHTTRRRNTHRKWAQRNNSSYYILIGIVKQGSASPFVHASPSRVSCVTPSVGNARCWHRVPGMPRQDPNARQTPQSNISISRLQRCNARRRSEIHQSKTPDPSSQRGGCARSWLEFVTSAAQVVIGSKINIPAHWHLISKAP